MKKLGVMILMFLLMAPAAGADPSRKFHDFIKLTPKVVPVPESPITVVTQCPDGKPTPLNFKIDCSALTDDISKANCPLFLQDVACKVYPIYQKLTGGVLEQYCSTLTYHIFTYDNWPATNNQGAGGQTDGSQCRIDYHEGNSVNPGAPSPPDPSGFGAKPAPEAYGVFARDTHEILHAIQYTIDPALVGTKDHPFFEPSMAEVSRQLGTSYEKTLADAEDEYQQYSNDPKNCSQAEAAMSSNLYAGWLTDGSSATNVVKDIYANLLADPEVEWVRAPISNAYVNNPGQSYLSPVLKTGDGKEVDRVLANMSGGKFRTSSGQIVDSKAYLIQHGCPAF